MFLRLSIVSGIPPRIADLKPEHRVRIRRQARLRADIQHEIRLVAPEGLPLPHVYPNLVLGLGSGFGILIFFITLEPRVE